jgi:hypothetical protein
LQAVTTKLWFKFQKKKKKKGPAQGIDMGYLGWAFVTDASWAGERLYSTLDYLVLAVTASSLALVLFFLCFVLSHRLQFPLINCLST